MYNYKAVITRVIDGDTVDMLIDLGFDIKVKQRVRLAGIDTPELNSRNLKEREVAKIAKDYLIKLTAGQDITIKSEKRKWDKYNRYLAYIYVSGRPVNCILLGEGLAKAYDGGIKEKWTVEELDNILKGW